MDGGFVGSADDLINFLDDYYDTDTIDLMISTHPDGDHTGGLLTVMEELKVGELWMHRPWEYEGEVYSYLAKGTTSRTFSDSMKRALSSAWELEKLANRKGVPITEPFENLSWADGRLTVLGPSQPFYADMAEQFGAKTSSLSEMIKSVATATKERIVDLWDDEALVEPDTTAVTRRNNSSVILHAQLDDTPFLFTGDAGVSALEPAVDFRDSLGLGPANYTQLPHHGAKRNVGPSIMDRLFGSKVSEGDTTGKAAVVSAAKKGEPKHPSQRVINAACKRGAKVYVTAGTHMYFMSNDRLMRPGWSSLLPRPYEAEYDEE